MASSKDGNIGLYSGYTDGDNGWTTQHNNNWDALDLLTQLTVKNATTTAPPGSPSNGDAYVIPTGATGAWAGLTNQIAVWVARSSAWAFYTPKNGWVASDQSAGVQRVYNGSSWALTTTSSVANSVTFNNGGTGAASGATFNGGAAVTISRNTIGAAASGANGDITSLTGLTTALSIGQGGTGQTTAAAALTALGGVASSTLGANNGTATLDSSGKLTAAQIPASLVGAVVYQGVWNASTNSPTLASGTGTKGNYYKVSVAGTTAIDGISSWNVGDTIIFDGTTWDKIDGISSEVVSVFGQTGVVPNLSGDATTSGSSAVTLAASGVTAASYGDSTHVAQITFDAKGRATLAAAVAIAFPVTSVFGQTGVVGNLSGDVTTSGSSATTLATSGVTAGTYTKVTVDAKGRVTVGASLSSGDVPILNQNTTGTAASVAGGATGSIPYQSGAGATAFVSGNSAANDQVVVSHGTGSAAQAPTLSNAPALSAANMTGFPTLNQNTTGTAANVAGVVAIANGGTGQSTASAALTALGGAPLVSPAITGTPTVPTAASGTNTTQIASTAYVQAAVAGLQGINVIVNGDCSISQVNGGSLITIAGATWPVDNILFNVSQASKLQVQQVNNKLNSLGATAAVTTSVLSSYTPIATDNFIQRIAIEGFNFARFQYGSANAKAGSLQFKVNASVAGTYSGTIENGAFNRSYPFSFTVAANTDTLIQLPNIPGDTGGTWVGATNAAAAYINFDVGSGSNFKSTAGTWQTGNYVGVTGSTSLVSQVNGSTLTITDVQFEVSPVCNPFERKLYDQNLRECQRYLRPVGQYSLLGQAVLSTQAEVFSFGPPMRSIPSFTTISTPNFSNAAGSNIASTAIAVLALNPDGIIISTINFASGMVAGNATYMNTGSGYFGAQI